MTEWSLKADFINRYDRSNTSYTSYETKYELNHPRGSNKLESNVLKEQSTRAAGERDEENWKVTEMLEFIFYSNNFFPKPNFTSIDLLLSEKAFLPPVLTNREVLNSSLSSIFTSFANL